MIQDLLSALFRVPILPGHFHRGVKDRALSLPLLLLPLHTLRHHRGIMGFFATALRLARNPNNSKRFRIKFRTLVGHQRISLYAAITSSVYKIEKTSPKPLLRLPLHPRRPTNQTAPGRYNPGAKREQRKQVESGP
jgi:hypothetical protein